MTGGLAIGLKPFTQDEAATMARPRSTITADLASAPSFSADEGDGSLVAGIAWVRATEILLLAQCRLSDSAYTEETEISPATFDNAIREDR